MVSNVLSRYAAVLSAALLLSIASGYARAMPICPPGADWLSSCPAGIDTFHSEALITLDFGGLDLGLGPMSWCCHLQQLRRPHSWSLVCHPAAMCSRAAQWQGWVACGVDATTLLVLHCWPRMGGQTQPG